MKKNYEIMASRQLKNFFKLITNQYGEVPDNFKKLAFIQGKEKIYIITRDIEQIDLEVIRINSLGLYIAEVKNEQLRLSIEGAQLIGPNATKNVCEINKEQLKKWFKGDDIDVDKEYEGFAIIKHENDYLGSGKYKEGMILNFVPKARRLIEMH